MPFEGVFSSILDVRRLAAACERESQEWGVAGMDKSSARMWLNTSLPAWLDCRQMMFCRFFVGEESEGSGEVLCSV